VLGDGEPKIGAHGKPVLFLHPKDFNGCLVELEQGMSITGAIVLYAVTWFLVLFVVLPLRLSPNGPGSSPARPQARPANLAMRRKTAACDTVRRSSGRSSAGIIMSGVISVRDFDWMGRIPPAPDGTGG
jgi:hypothetical protein